MGNRGSNRARERDNRQNRDLVRQAVEASLIDAPLPIGWEEGYTPKGYTYYIDHTSGTTSWNDPRNIGGARRKRKKARRGKPPKYKLTFYGKVQQLRGVLHRMKEDNGTLQITVSRENLFQDAYDFIRNLDPLTLTRRLYIKYENEEGLDYGGMSREFFLSLSKEILNPKMGLFKKIGSSYEYRIDPNSKTDPDTLEKFYFVGILMGMAIYHGFLFSSYFSIPFYKALLGKEISVEDFKSVDHTLYSSMKKILEIDNVEDLYLTFSVTEKLTETENPKQKVEKTREVELKEGGSNIDVTNENKKEFVDLVVDYYLFNAPQQMNSLRMGFEQFIPPDKSQLFEPEEMAILIGGTTEIDVEDLKKNTEYQGDFTPTSQTITWFWNVLRSFSGEEKRKFLRFVTGTHKVPIGGFSSLYGSIGPQKFTITEVNKSGVLPTAHSCFNRLELPSSYSSEDELKKLLLYAVNETKGFGLE